jgi:hypothetical protein
MEKENFLFIERTVAKIPKKEKAWPIGGMSKKVEASWRG